jgi:hypothetical protein
MLIVVEDIARARAFYEQVLEQRPLMDFGANVEYEGHFSIHLKSLHQETIGEWLIPTMTINSPHGSFDLPLEKLSRFSHPIAL